MSESLTRTPTISDLADPNAKTLFERLKMHCNWKTCLAIFFLQAREVGFTVDYMVTDRQFIEGK